MWFVRGLQYVWNRPLLIIVVLEGSKAFTFHLLREWSDFGRAPQTEAFLRYTLGAVICVIAGMRQVQIQPMRLGPQNPLKYCALVVLVDFLSLQLGRAAGAFVVLVARAFGLHG